jgi:hypothetical protein
LRLLLKHQATQQVSSFLERLLVVFFNSVLEIVSTPAFRLLN